MYEISQVYFISNLVNLNSELYQLQENDINSLSEKIIKILNKDCFIKFIIKGFNSKRYKDSELWFYQYANGLCSIWA
ncbi:unnamed protein product [Rhizophagus irregularis]|uniref:Uncharacterized protein n=1 Tax=Rhizophagus irregularis TaxID=588596 RepID=A0A915Z1L0_9GLOM|nr:unnamed protein product [Rhizophagus irregularis]